MATTFGGSSGGGTVDWQQFYVPMKKSMGYSQAYVDQVNAERMRQAQLQAAQLNQANAQTAAMQQQSQTPVRNSTSSSSISSGSYTPPAPSTGGTYTIPAAGTTGGSTGGGVSGAGISPLSGSLQEQYDPWSRYRDDAGNLLANKMNAPSPSNLYLGKLNEMVNGTFTPDDPSYQWRYDQGQQAVERSLAARGLLNSGNAAIELQQYGQGAASQEYGAQFARMLQGLTGTEEVYNTQMSRLMQMAGVNLDPTAGGKLAVSTGELGVQQGQLGLNSQKLAADYDLGMRELVLKQMLAQQAQAGNMGGMQGTDWSAIFRTS